LPLYPYRCTQCGHRFEKIQHFKDEPIKACPECGGAVERVLTAPGLQFKGAGWYVNDYAAKSSAGGEGGSAEKKPATESKAGSKPDTASAGSSGKADAGSSAPAPAPSAKKD
jgi:putative FmdB family regulatory protein